MQEPLYTGAVSIDRRPEALPQKFGCNGIYVCVQSGVETEVILSPAPQKGWSRGEAPF